MWAPNAFLLGPLQLTSETLFTFRLPRPDTEQPGPCTWSWGGRAPPSPPLLLSHPGPPSFMPRSVMNRLCGLRFLYFSLSCASVFSSAKWETNSDLTGTLGGSYEGKKKKKHENVWTQLPISVQAGPPCLTTCTSNFAQPEVQGGQTNDTYIGLGTKSPSLVLREQWWPRTGQKASLAASVLLALGWSLYTSLTGLLEDYVLKAGLTLSRPDT